MTSADTKLRGRASAVIPAGLTLENVTRRFGGKPAVDDVSFDIKPSEVMCLLGPSGCGKSTLLRLLAGVEELTSGRILMDGREVAGPERFVPPEERGIGLVFQDYALFPHLNALDNVRFGLNALPRDLQTKIARSALARVGLDGREDAFPDMLSGGEQQRIALVRAMVPRPRMILMDEPFSNLDKRMRDSVRHDVVALLREAGATAVIVTHDPEEAMRIADRIVLMRAGRVVQVGSGRELYTHPADLQAARFFCDINEINGVVRNGAVETLFGRFPAPGLGEGMPVVVCVRPFGVGLHPSGTGVPARILARRFNMQVDLFEISVQGLDLPFVARIRHAPPFYRGDDVGVTIDPSEVLVFAAISP